MDFTLFLYSVGLWVVFVFLAILNGMIRNSVYGPKLGEPKAHVISSFVAVCYILVVNYFFINAVKISANLTDLLLIGLFWVTITVLFEFAFGHYVVGHSWEHLLSDYNIIKGRLWSLVLLATFGAPVFWGLVLGLS
jgi:hypothetical protein